jgi:hypothetical protein
MVEWAAVFSHSNTIMLSHFCRKKKNNQCTIFSGNATASHTSNLYQFESLLLKFFRIFWPELEIFIAVAESNQFYFSFSVSAFATLLLIQKSQFCNLKNFRYQA